MEEWKDIQGYEGLYQVSNLGRVKSLERRVCNHNNGATRLIREQIITPTDNGNGYKIVGLHLKRKRQNKYVHRLVAEHFLEKPSGKDFVNHIDYDKSNNAVANLEWCTQIENVAYSVEHMKKPKTKRRPPKTGEKYIKYKNVRGKIVYRVAIKQLKIDRTFKTLEEAIRYRNEAVQKWQKA